MTNKHVKHQKQMRQWTPQSELSASLFSKTGRAESQKWKTQTIPDLDDNTLRHRYRIQSDSVQTKMNSKKVLPEGAVSRHWAVMWMTSTPSLRSLSPKMQTQ